MAKEIVFTWLFQAQTSETSKAAAFLVPVYGYYPINKNVGHIRSAFIKVLAQQV